MFDGGKITTWKQGNVEFAIRQFNPFYAMTVLGDLQKLLLPTIGGAVEGLRNDKIENDMIAAAKGALVQMAKSLDGKALEKACKLLLDADYIGVKMEGKKDFERATEDVLAEVYWGRPWDMVALCVKVFEVNFMDFTKSSSVPTGVIEVIEEIKTAFLAK